MSEQQQQAESQGEEAPQWQPPTIGGQVQPGLHTFSPVPVSKEEREQLEQELIELDPPDEREAPTSEDARP